MTSTLAVEDLRFRYSKSSEELFDGLNYEFAAEKVTGITGPSGRGKSTLLYVLGLLLGPSSGKVLLDGQDVSRLSDAKRSTIRASDIGFVFQDSELDPTRSAMTSVVEPALYAGRPMKSSRAQAINLMKRLGLDHRASHKPGQVSGGQAQRLAVCRALINNPRIVFADEPTGNLDRDNAKLVLEALAGAASEGCTVLIATHDPFVLESVNEVLEL